MAFKTLSIRPFLCVRPYVSWQAPDIDIRQAVGSAATIDEKSTLQFMLLEIMQGQSRCRTSSIKPGSWGCNRGSPQLNRHMETV